jgi:hypothetical protein
MLPKAIKWASRLAFRGQAGLTSNPACVTPKTIASFFNDRSQHPIRFRSPVLKDLKDNMRIIFFFFLIRESLSISVIKSTTIFIISSLETIS